MTERQGWMAVLARASATELRACLADAPMLPPHRCLRGPEPGLAMLRGRIGGGGAAFSLGEATVTRCTVQAGGHVGHCWRIGQDTQAAELAAVLDAALQHDALRPALLRAVVAPLAAAQDARRAAQAARAAATKVEFTTLSAMRG